MHYSIFVNGEYKVEYVIFIENKREAAALEQIPIFSFPIHNPLSKFSYPCGIRMNGFKMVMFCDINEDLPSISAKKVVELHKEVTTWVKLSDVYTIKSPTKINPIHF